MPIVSIIVPTHNRRALLEKALESIFAQTFTDFELIIINDGSTDDTKLYIEALADPRVIAITTQHQGAAMARNTGIEKASGSLIAFCDSDDCWMPDRLKTQVAVFEQENPPVLVFSDTEILRDNEPTGKTHFADQPPHKGEVFNALLRDNFIPTSTVMVRRDVVDQTVGFEDPFCPAEDYRLWLRLARLGKFDFVDRPLAYYRRHDDQIGANIAVMFPACAFVIDDALETQKMSASQVRGLPLRLWQLHFVAARTWMRLGNPEAARTQYRRAQKRKSTLKVRLFQLLSYINI